jgi:hypothetical protein
MANSFRLPNQVLSDYFNAPLGTYDITGTQSFDFNQPFQAGNISGFPSGGGVTADYSGGATANAFGGGGLSWGAVQGLGNLANMGIQAFGNQQGTKAGQDYLDFLADMRDANFGSDLIERNIGIADSFRIPDVIAGQRVDNPRYRQEMKMMNVPKLAGRLSGFLNT